MAFRDYLNIISESIRRNNGDDLQYLLDVNTSRAKEAVFEVSYNRGGWNPGQEVAGALMSLPDQRQSWVEIVTSHCRALHQLNQGNTEMAYTHVDAMVLPFTKVYREEQEAWLGAVLARLAKNMRATALAADAENRKAGRKAATLENCGGSLQRVFASAIGGNNAKKKEPVLDIVITLFKVYFHLNTLQLCKNLINAVERLDFNAFPAASRVTYMFYMGRLSIFNNDYEGAEHNLEYAFRHCHKEAVKNKSCIIYYLVPVKMLLGQLPSQSALEKYNLGIYVDIVEAMRSGSVQQMNEALEAQQWRFIRAGTYLVLEKLKQAVLRRLLKKVVLLTCEGGNQLALSLLQKALEWQKMALEMDEVECLVANLIYRGYVKGYISHSKRVLVLSKANPFPALNTVSREEIF